MSFEHEKARIHGEVIGAEAAIHSPVNAVDQLVVDKYCEVQKLPVRDHGTKEPKIVAMRRSTQATNPKSSKPFLIFVHSWELRSEGQAL